MAVIKSEATKCWWLCDSSQQGLALRATWVQHFVALASWFRISHAGEQRLREVFEAWDKMQPRVHCCSTEQKAYRAKERRVPSTWCFVGWVTELPEDGQGQVVCLLWCVESKSRKHEEEAERLFQGKPEDTCSHKHCLPLTWNSPCLNTSRTIWYNASTPGGCILSMFERSNVFWAFLLCCARHSGLWVHSLV